MHGIVPRARDGRISRKAAATLARVAEDTISSWISRGHLTDVVREGREIWLNPVEVIETEYRLHEAERKRLQRLLGAA